MEFARSNQLALQFAALHKHLATVRRGAASRGSINVAIDDATDESLSEGLLTAIQGADPDQSRPLRIELKSTYEMEPLSNAANKCLSFFLGKDSALVDHDVGMPSAQSDAETWRLLGKLLAKCVLYHAPINVCMHEAFFHCLARGYESAKRVWSSDVLLSKLREASLSAAHEGFTTAFDWELHLDMIAQHTRDFRLLFPQEQIDVSSVLKMIRQPEEDEPNAAIVRAHIDFLRSFLETCPPVVQQQFLARATGRLETSTAMVGKVHLEVRGEGKHGDSVHFERKKGCSAMFVSFPHCTDSKALNQCLNRALSTLDTPECPCSICCESFYEADGVFCEMVDGVGSASPKHERHFTCSSCLEGWVQAQCTLSTSEGGVTIQEIARRKAIVGCPGTGCAGEIGEQSIIRATPRHARESYTDVKEKVVDFVVTSRLRPEIEKDLNAEIERLAQLSEVERQVIKHRRNIEENILTAKCQQPTCGQAFTDWDNCSKLHCNRCKSLFCAKCWKNIGDLPNPYTHVEQCLGQVYGDRLEIKKFWQGRAKGQIHDYLSKIGDSEVHRKVQEAIPPEPYFDGLGAE
jgi:hypothetical protein